MQDRDSLSAPRTMKAWVIREDRHGDPERAMALETVPVPRPSDGEVVLAVMAAGINYNGIWVCRGEPVSLSRLKTGFDFHITGSDASGVVVEVGRGVTRWKPGDEVVVHCNVSCGQCAACNGRDPLACDQQKIWGYEVNYGSFAPYTIVQAQQLLPKPARLTWEDSASYGLCLFTAYRMLFTRGQLQPGEIVLVWGASGGLGVFAIQLALLAGATPVCVVSSPEKADLCRSLGATLFVDRRHHDLASQEGKRSFGAAIRGVTGGRDPDLVFEHVGQKTFATSVYVCAKFGRVVICGATTGYDLDFDVRYLWMRQKTIIGSHFANSWDASRANQLVSEGRVRPVVSQVFPFEEIPRAQATQASSAHAGKLVALVGAERAGLGARSS
jgi:crotonyl-CoA carboxylase/reductase